MATTACTTGPEVGGAAVDRGEIGRDDDGRHQGDGGGATPERECAASDEPWEIPSTRAIRGSGGGEVPGKR